MKKRFQNKSLYNKFMDIKKITEKITLPVAIVVSVVVLAIGFFAVQYSKQQSIERQQILKFEEDRKIEATRLEQEKKEYVADRKADCLNIYKTESDKWNNVKGWRYSEDEDTCLIRYKDPNPKSDAECDKSYPTDGKLGLIFFFDNSLCKEGEFENSF